MSTHIACIVLVQASLGVELPRLAHAALFPQLQQVQSSSGNVFISCLWPSMPFNLCWVGFTDCLYVSKKGDTYIYIRVYIDI